MRCLDLLTRCLARCWTALSTRASASALASLTTWTTATLAAWATTTLTAKTTGTASALPTAATRATTTTLRTARLRGALLPALRPFIAEWLGCGVVIKAFSLFADESAIDKTFQLAHIGQLIRRDEADRIANGLRTSRASYAVDIIFHDVRKVEIHHM